MKIKVLNTVDPSYSKFKFKTLKKYCSIKTIISSRSEAINFAQKSDVIIAGGRIKIDKKFIENCKNLKLILSPSTGTDHLCLKTIKKRKIKLIHIGKNLKLIKNFTATSEMSFALLLSLVRKIMQSVNDVNQGIWSRDKNSGFQLKDKTLGILGLGRLGKISAKIAKGFQMKVLANDIKKINYPGVKKVSFNNLFKNSDIIFLHVHLDSTTENLINKKVFKIMKKNAILINTCRGKIINEKDLLYALKNKIIAGAALDVIDGEWLSRKNLIKHPIIKYAKNNNNLVVTPHIAGSTYESIKMARDHIFELLIKYLKQKKL